MTSLKWILISMCTSLCISIIFFSIATPVYITVEAHNEAQCHVDKIEIRKKTCEDVCTTTNNVRTCTYKDCWYPVWYVTINSETLSNNLGDWIFSSRRYDDENGAKNRGNWRAIGKTYDCWYRMKNDDPEATWHKPNHTASIVLFTFGGVFALPPVIYILFLFVKFVLTE